jgi:hypothetical protein
MPMTEVELFFGRNVPARAPVSEEEWQRFLDDEVTPRFPDGFSVANLLGQYRNRSGMIVRESSKELLIVLAGSLADRTKLNAIRDAYKRRFSQESVLLTEHPACAAF